MKLIFSILLLATVAKAEIPISNLPLYTGSQVGATDTVPFVYFGTNTTGQLRLSQIFNIPSLQNPTFTGNLTTATGTFTGLITVPTGSFTNGAVINVATIGNFGSPVQHNLNTVTGPFTSCGSLAGAAGCVKMLINGEVRYFPYY